MHISADLRRDKYVHSDSRSNSTIIDNKNSARFYVVVLKRKSACEVIFVCLFKCNTHKSDVQWFMCCLTTSEADCSENGHNTKEKCERRKLLFIINISDNHMANLLLLIAFTAR